MAVGAVLGTGITLVGQAIDAFKPKEPTPEEQKAKAGVWYSMLQNWVTVQPQSSESFGSKWVDMLPFAQKSTKQRFISENISGKSYDYIISVLVGKINDELVKGGFSPVSESSVLAGMGAGDNVVNTAKSASVTPSTSIFKDQAGKSLGTVEDVNESRTFFYIMSLLAVAGLLLFFGFGKKGKRR